MIRLAMLPPLLTALVSMARGSDAPAATRRERIPELARARQIVLVVSEDWDNARATLGTFEREAPSAPWRVKTENVPVSIGRNGMAWGVGVHGGRVGKARLKKEGDGRSPAGVFRIGTVFGYASRSASRISKMPYLPIVPSLRWVDDPKSRFYNRCVDLEKAGAEKDWESAEEMLLAGGNYRWGAFVEHNVAGTPGLGSCIFLHIWEGAGVGTAGCTAMAPARMEKLARWLDRRKNPLIVQLPREEYLRRKEPWSLP